MLRHYKGSLGEFDYHDDVFSVETKHCNHSMYFLIYTMVKK